MSSDASRETAGSERTGPDPAPSRVDRLRGSLSTYVLHVETTLAVASLGVGLLAVPIVLFGLFAALPTGPPPPEGTDPGTPILDVGLVVAVVSLALVVTLAVTVLVHGYTELRGRGPPSVDDLDAPTAVYGAVRAAETLTAGAFLAGLLAAAGSLSILGRVPDSFWLLVGVAGVLLPVVVIVHAAGAVVGYVLGVGRDDGTGPASAG